MLYLITVVALMELHQAADDTGNSEGGRSGNRNMRTQFHKKADQMYSRTNGLREKENLPDSRCVLLTGHKSEDIKMCIKSWWTVEVDSSNCCSEESMTWLYNKTDSLQRSQVSFRHPGR